MHHRIAPQPSICAPFRRCIVGNFGLAEATDDCLLLLTATPHDGYDETFTSLLEFLEPALAPPGRPLRFERYRRHLVRRLKRHIITADGRPKFPERTVTPLPVTLQGPEVALHQAVEAEYRRLQEVAQGVGGAAAEPIYLLATVLRKRASSSRAALRQTITERRNTIREDLPEVEIRREHIRALRRGETISDEALRQLERDLVRGYLSALRRLAQRARRLVDEEAALDEIEARLDACADQPESKLECLVAWLGDLHARLPSAKAIVFTEYADTAQAIADHLEAIGYGGGVGLLTGGFSRAQRREALARFASPPVRVLVATDAAGEGLNLQERCHHLAHFDLPWNPNRVEQRNGRIDRYGQANPPQIAFLYAQGTYDGEILARLTLKIENQIRRLGAVGDVLGNIQAERIEQWLWDAPSDERAAMDAIERQQDDLLNRASTPEALKIPLEDEQHRTEIARAEEAVRRFEHASVSLRAFIERAVRAAGGSVERRNGTLLVATPREWRDGSLQAQYRMVAGADGEGPPQAINGSPEAGEVLHEEHPLVRAALRWVRASRFDPKDDHRLAYTVAADIGAPDLVAAFLVTIRDGTGHETQRLEAVQVGRDLRPSHDREADLALLRADGGGNVPTDRLSALFEDWWHGARTRAEQEARRRAAEWTRLLAADRAEEGRRLREALDQWDRASLDDILGPYRAEYEQVQLIAGPSGIPPSVLRRVRVHRQRYQRRLTLLEAYLRLEEPGVEPLGVLLRVPASEGTSIG